MNMRSARELLRLLMQKGCPVCNRLKKPRQSFCRQCFMRLPQGLRTALNNKIGKGYAEAYDIAFQWLTDGPDKPEIERTLRESGAING